jgi:hypothetical protein
MSDDGTKAQEGEQRHCDQEQINTPGGFGVALAPSPAKKAAVAGVSPAEGKHLPQLDL